MPNPDLRPRAGDALIVVDLQRDFLPGGALGVPGGDAVIPPLNEYLATFERRRLPIFATRDWHTPDHCSFRDRGGPWPPHCVAGTPGAAFAPGLVFPESTQIVSKADQRDRDAYSGFDHTDLARSLRERGVKRVFVGGLATDYCVRATVLDGLRTGFEVVVLEDAVRAVDVTPGDGERALEEMRSAGARTARLADVTAPT